MQIVIDIPEEEYNLIKMKLESNIGGVSSEAERVIANGTPLPKGYGRLISADELKKKFHSECRTECAVCPYGRDGFDCGLIDYVSAIVETDKEMEE